MATRQAAQACVPCRTLKRKCTKELPSCSLCRQLMKRCEYRDPARARPIRSEDVNLLSRLEKLERRLGNESSRRTDQSMGEANTTFGLSPEISNAWRVEFPTTYFLDWEEHQPMPAGTLNPKVVVPPEIRSVLQSREAMESLCQMYMLSTQSWLPMISKKRLFERVAVYNETTDVGVALLLLCMKLASETPPAGEHAASSALYCMAKEFYFRLETSCAISLQLFQSSILISLYEIGHALYPAACLSASNAARLGMIMGFHDRTIAPQLFKDADTWTEREEERRSWWAIVILERYANLGISGLPLVTPEPIQGTLLPCTESSWNQGQIGSNVPLFASSLSTNIEIGSYASICQACHILGLVLRHRNSKHSITDGHFRLTEAWQLHQTLVSLHTHLTERATTSMDDSNSEIAIAFCSSARIILYNMYACNEHYLATEARIMEETQMQAASVEGLNEICLTICPLAQHISIGATTTDNHLLSKCLLLCHCLYHVASDYAWFIREENAVEKVASLKVVVELLRTIGTRWRVAGEYLKRLENDGALDSIVE